MSQLTRLSWGRLPYPAPAEVVEIVSADQLARARPPLLAYGLGRSYGDVCLNPGGTLLRTRHLRRILDFDAGRGRLRAEAGVSVAEVLSVILPAGWCLPVLPGTQFVTLGGAVANDVHGKNHHRDGSFGRFVRSLELWRSDGSRMTCSRDEHAALFAATIGGLGLTGLIRSVEIDLIPVSSARIAQRSTRFHRLDDLFVLNDRAAGSARYTVAWIDLMGPRGRGIFFEGDHEGGADLPERRPRAKPRVSMPLDAPGPLISRTTSRVLNALYWRNHPAGPSDRSVSFERFFFPLDAIGGWNRLYGRRGFYQYQFAVPHEGARAVVSSVLDAVGRHPVTAPLAVLKSLGGRPSPGMLSFPMPGITLAIDVANHGEKTHRLFAELDAVVRDAGGRLYPAKDARMSAHDFQRAYPRWREFLQHVDPAFSSAFWRRVARTD